MQSAIFILSISYFLGSIPFGVLFARLLGKKDLRQHGSGNIGATNAIRVGGKFLGFLTLTFDMLKGIVAVVIARIMVPEVEIPCCYSTYEPLHYASAFVVVVGHIYPIWLKFKGGKGVATSIAAIFVLSPFLAIFMVLTWLLIYKISKTSSLASIFSVLSTALVACVLFSDIGFWLLMSGLAIIIVFRHKENIRRMVLGNEL